MVAVPDAVVPSVVGWSKTHFWAPHLPPVEQLPEEAPHSQSAVEQSLSATHACPNWQPTQLLPPQSTSVSEPFLMPSEQLGAQVPELQLPLAQSPPTLHDFPVVQPAHDPPQSTSVSLPFLTPSEQLTWAH